MSHPVAMDDPSSSPDPPPPSRSQSAYVPMSPPSDSSYYLTPRPSDASYVPQAHAHVMLPPPMPSSTIVAPPLPAHLSLPLPSLNTGMDAETHSARNSHEGFTHSPRLDIPLPEPPSPSAPLRTPPPPPPRVPSSEKAGEANKQGKANEESLDLKDEVCLCVSTEDDRKPVKTVPPPPTSVREELCALLLHLVLGALLGLIFSLFAFLFNFCVPSLQGRPWRRNIFNIGVAIGVVTQASLLTVLGINVKRWITANILDRQ